MSGERTFTLTDIARRLREPQHRLIHLCETEVVEPDVQDARGRGSSRLFSARNVLEFAIALRLAQVHQPLAVAKAVLHVLRRFQREVSKSIPGFALPESLREPSAPDFRLILSDGKFLYFLLGVHGRKPRLLGGVPIDGRSKPRHARGQVPRSSSEFGGPEGSSHARIELSITNVARDLLLD